ncbi:MAG: hypothetical protein ACI8WM_001003 [Burkholderiaceae bacterium]|jgi:hypothetical protein
MNKSVRPRLISLGTALVLLAISAAASANDRSSVNWSVRIATPYTYPPAPVYVQPPAVYYTPQPIYVQPAPIYVRTRPVFVPQYQANYSPYPGPYYREYGWRRHHHHYHDRD